jgi:hypothetical protein
MESGAVSAEEYEGWLADLGTAAHDGAYAYSVTTFAYLAEA